MEEPKCLLTEEWIKMMWYVRTVEYYSTIKKNEIMPFAATWMDLESIILSEISQIENEVWHTFYVESKKKWYKWTYLQNRKRFTDLEKELMVAERKR